MAVTAIQRRVKRQLDDGKQIDSSMIHELIIDHTETKERTYNLYERYKASKQAVPIFGREVGNDASKINNKLNNDFFSEIIDVKQGYMIGKPIIYSVDKNKYSLEHGHEEQEYCNHCDFISELSARNNFIDIDSELIKLVSICGHAGREIFTDTEGNIRIINLNPWEIIFLTNVFGEVDYALRYYTEINDDDEEVVHVEFFDDERVQYFEAVGEEYIFQKELPHLFGVCPIVKAVNNEEEIGDVDKVLSLIDGYDRTLSDISSEIEQFRLAYMYFKGQEPTPEVIENAKKTGGFFVGENGEVGFITKNINDAVVEHHLDRLEDNILRFAKSVNFGEDQFTGNLSGVAMKYKLFALESKSAVLETKMHTALRNQFKIITNLLNLQSIDLNYLHIFFDFTRNIPFNMQDEIQANDMLVNLVSERTRLAQLPFVDDVDYEIRQMEMDRARELDSYGIEEFNEDNFNNSTSINTDDVVDTDE